MNRESLRIIYMGTADFAVPPLRALVEGGYQVVAVVTMPDKPMGRGMKLQSSQVKIYAQEQGIEVLQPEKLKDETFVSRLHELRPDLGIVVAFRMLPEVVWNLPRLGTINLHGSLLPRYRGAAPIHWAVMNGDTETGVTTFRLKHELDTGDLLLQAKTPIAYTDTTGEVYERLMHIGSEVLRQTVDLFLGDSLPQMQAQEQLSEVPTHAPKLTKENTQINWQRPATELYNFVRGLTPFPAAWAKLKIGDEEIVCKISQTEVLPSTGESLKSPAGTLIIGKKTLDVVTGEGLLRILMLQPSGKKSMSAEAFVNGLRNSLPKE